MRCDAVDRATWSCAGFEDDSPQLKTHPAVHKAVHVHIHILPPVFQLKHHHAQQPSTLATMASSFALRSLMLPASILSALVTALPEASPLAEAARVAPRDPLITPSPAQNLPSRTRRRRDIFDNLKSDVGNVLSELGSDVPSYVASGIPNFFQGFPTGNAVQSSLGLDDAQVSAYPTQVLNIPPYANYTNQGWNVRFHGNVYKQPDTDNKTLDDLANVFLIDVDIQDLPASQQDQARNLTAEIFVLQQGDVNVSTIHLEPAPSAGADGGSNGGGGVEAGGGEQSVTLPYPTTPEGDFDVFVPIDSNGLKAGNSTDQIQKLNTYVEGASLGNSTAYLVPDTGLTVISDIDDILRVTKIYEPKQGLLNSFAKPFEPWMNMPEVYANWSQSLPNMHFHYRKSTSQHSHFMTHTANVQQSRPPQSRLPATTCNSSTLPTREAASTRVL